MAWVFLRRQGSTFNYYKYILCVNNAVVIVHTEAMIMDIRKFKQTGTETSVNKSTFLIDLLEEHEPCRLKLHHNKKFK